MQEPEVPEAVKVQVTGEPEEGVAVSVINAPVVSPATSKVGVVSTVLLSVEEVPLSEPDCRSGAGVGVLGVMVTVPDDAAEKFPVASTENALYKPGTSPKVAKLVGLFAVAIETLFHSVPSAAVIVAVSLGVILVLTR